MQIADKELLLQMTLLEKNVSLLYARFSNEFDLDKMFWRELALEEKVHATILETITASIEKTNASYVMVPESNLTLVIAANEKAISLLSGSNSCCKSRVETLNIALEIERSAGEMYFQKTIFKSKSAELFLTSFQGFAEAEKDHEARIRDRLHEIHNPQIQCFTP